MFFDGMHDLWRVSLDPDGSLSVIAAGKLGSDSATDGVRRTGNTLQE